MDRPAYEWDVWGVQSRNKLAVVITAGKTNKLQKLQKMGSRAEGLHVNPLTQLQYLFFFPKQTTFCLKHDPAVSPYPCGVVDPKYSADDVLLQVGRDEFHLDRSMPVDSIFWPVLWTQLNKIGTYTHTYMHTQRPVHTQTRQRKTHRENKENGRQFIGFRIQTKPTELSDTEFKSLYTCVKEVYVGQSSRT